MLLLYAANTLPAPFLRLYRYPILQTYVWGYVIPSKEGIHLFLYRSIFTSHIHPLNADSKTDTRSVHTGVCHSAFLPASYLGLDTRYYILDTKYSIPIIVFASLIIFFLIISKAFLIFMCST